MAGLVPAIFFMVLMANRANIFVFKWCYGGQMKKYNRVELLDILKKNFTDVISKSKLDKREDLPGSATYVRYFGSWSNAIKAAGLKSKSGGKGCDNEYEISEQDACIINGELLGDGSIVWSGANKKSCCFSHSTANIEYGKYLYNKLSFPLLKEEITKRDGQFRTRSKSNIVWNDWRNKWYGEIKIVPKDLILNSDVILHWYLGDGYLEKGTACFSTCGFRAEDIDFLVELLNNYGFKCNKNKRSGGYYIIRLSREGSCKLLKEVSCPGFYTHKWNLI